MDLERVCTFSSTRLYPPGRFVEVSSARGCHRVDRRCAWVKEDIYGSQTRPISRYKAAVAVDNKVHVPGVGQMTINIGPLSQL